MFDKISPVVLGLGALALYLVFGRRSQGAPFMPQVTGGSYPIQTSQQDVTIAAIKQGGDIASEIIRNVTAPEARGVSGFTSPSLAGALGDVGALGGLHGTLNGTGAW